MTHLTKTCGVIVALSACALWIALGGSAIRAGEGLPEGAAVATLKAFPAEISLKDRFSYAQVIVTAELVTGEQLDVTRIAKTEAVDGVVQVAPSGRVRPVADGSGAVTFTLNGQSASVSVSVTGQTEKVDVSFVRDVMPVLSKAGCNAGTCHGAQQGKRGFSLSLRGYDPLFDHRALTDDLAARRTNRSAPDRSLMLQKPSGAAPHSGGVLFQPQDPYYQVLRAWIAGGVKLDLDRPRVSTLEIYPKDPIVPLPGMKQQMIVEATYTDGTVRDVTAEAFIESNNTETVEADASGVLTAVRRGEAAVLARYEGRYTATTLAVMGDRSGFAWQDVPESNYIDTLAYKKLRRVKSQPSGLATDAEFLRRVYLDLTGLPPTPETVRAFLADPRETRTKRDALIDDLVGSADYVEYWTNKWSDLLQVNRKFLGEKGAWAFRNWIRSSITTNMPYDEFVGTILTSKGSTYENPPSAYYKILRQPEDLTENTTQLFLGIRFSCNKCHDHPFERWTQGQYYDFAAYFAQVDYKKHPGTSVVRKRGNEPGGDLALQEIVYDKRSGEVTHPRTGQVAAPHFPYEHGDESPESASRREQLAHWLTSNENPYFAKSYVNRIWSYLLGVGLIEPVDDLRASNPPTNPELLDALTEDFVSHGLDTRHLIRTICQSRVYQHSIATNEWNADDTLNYSHAYAKRLSAEMLYDAIHRTTGSQLKLPGVPVGFRSVELADTSDELDSGFLEQFGRPARESSCECERGSGMMLGPVMKLVNGPTIANAVADPNNRIAKAVAADDDNARVVEELFLAILNRFPTETETAEGVAAIAETGSRLEGAQDLVWALLNSSAFLFNR
jgi:hypothetical protein